MRKVLLLLVAIAGVAASTASLAAVTRVVAIRADGFAPVTRTIQTGDSIRWRNDDTVNHQVVADNGHFASPVLRPRQSYTRVFNTAGRFVYRDALEPAERGTIVVQGPPPSVSIARRAPSSTARASGSPGSSRPERRTSASRSGDGRTPRPRSRRWPTSSPSPPAATTGRLCRRPTASSRPAGGAERVRS